MTSRHVILIVITSLGLAASGCRSSQDADVAKMIAQGPPKRTAEQMAKTTARIKTFKDQSDAERAQWMNVNPDKVAEVNAKRAAAGFPPLGQEPNAKK